MKATHTPPRQTLVAAEYATAAHHLVRTVLVDVDCSLVHLFLSYEGVGSLLGDDHFFIALFSY